MNDRVDEYGAAYAGSQLQTQLYVNRRTSQLNSALRGLFPELAEADIDWRSPCQDDRYREYYGSAFLERLSLNEHVDALRRFWPSRGPQWDALALVRHKNQPHGVVLVEGKSYPNEMLKGSGAQAAPGSDAHTLIRTALAWTQGRIGMALDTEPWMGSLYQNANRLAHLYWLRSRGVRTWLAHLLFTDDPHGPTTAKQWEDGVETAEKALGIRDMAIEGAGHLLFPAGTREQLLGADL